jgi:hypothetical protein
MPSLRQAVFVGLLAALVVSPQVCAQNLPALTISPGKVTLLVGETHLFRAVGKDGRLRHNVRWSISPQNAATLSPDGDEVTVQAKEASSSVVLTADTEGDSAEATIEIRAGKNLTPGTTMWSVDKLPGCKATNMTQAVPSANGPDLYVDEECPQGRFIRALTADGRELWRKQITGSGADLTIRQAPKDDPNAQRLNPRAVSVCDAVSTGMTKEQVAKVVDGRNLRLEEKERQTNTWVLEEEGFRCAISFDANAATVFKKKKTIVTD